MAAWVFRVALLDPRFQDLLSSADALYALMGRP